MPIMTLPEMFTSPLTPALGFFCLAVGLYSLLVNAAVARHKHHPRAEKAARWGGWCYMAVGAALLLWRLVRGG